MVAGPRDAGMTTAYRHVNEVRRHDEPVPLRGGGRTYGPGHQGGTGAGMRGASEWTRPNRPVSSRQSA